MKLTKNFKKVLILFIIFFAGTGVFLLKLKSQMSSKSSTISAKAVEVSVVSARMQKVNFDIEIPGKVSAFAVANVRPQVDGIIQKVFFTEGGKVEKGQQLYQIDPTLYNIALGKANASYKALRKKRTRFYRLLKSGAISKQEYDDVNASYVAAFLDVKEAKTNLEYTKVYAPISGHIGATKFTKGTLVKSSQDEVLSVINQIDPIYVDVKLPTSDLALIQKQQEFLITTYLQNEEVKKKGKLAFFEKQVDETSDTFLVRFSFENSDLKLIPGMYVTNKIHIQPFNALTIQKEVVTRGRDGKLFVWIVDNQNRVHKKQIMAKKSYQNMLIVEEGLSEGDVVVYEGVQKIYEGLEVNPILLIAPRR